MKEAKVNAVVVTYNRLDLLKECIDALEKQTYKINKIIIVDNFSNDGTRSFLKQFCDNNKFVIEYLDSNQGGAGGFNHGIKKSFNYDCDWIWVMDDDTIPLPNALEVMINNKYINENIEKIGFTSSNVLWSNNEAGLINIPMPDNDYNKYLDNNIIKLKHTTFVSFLVRSDVVKEVGLPYKEFFIWGDDVEYSRRIYNKGYENYLINHSKVIHKRGIGKSNDLIDEDNINRLWLYKYAERNHMYLAKKQGIKELIKYLILWIIDLVRIMKPSTKYKLKKLMIHLVDAYKGLVFEPKVENV